MTITATLLHLLFDASRILKSKFAFFSSMNRRIPHTFFQVSSLRSSLFRFLLGKRESRNGLGDRGDIKLVAGGRDREGKERKSLLLSPDILPNASNCFRSLGASTVTRDPIILFSGKFKTTKIALKSAG